MLDFLRFIPYCHLIQHYPQCPDIHSWCNLDSICHLRSVIVRCPNKVLHIGTLLGWIHHMTQPKVAQFCNWTLLTLSRACLIDQNIVDFNVCVNNSSLMQIPESLQHILGPQRKLIFLHRLILAQDPSCQVVRPISSILHPQCEMLLSLTILVGFDNIWMVQLHVY